VWPLGYKEFLTPLLRENRYMECFRTMEVLDERRTVEQLHDLLFDKNEKYRLLESQEAYTNLVLKKFPDVTVAMGAASGGRA
jgi:hypothetical protein